MPKTKDGGFYAVHKGHTPGVYTSWPDCEAQVKGFRGAMYKKFATSRDAESFVESGQALPDTASTTSGKSGATRNAPVRHHPYETGQHHASRAPREAEPSSSTSSGIRGHGQRPRMEPDPQIASLFVQPTPVGARPVQEVASAKGPRSFHSLSTNDKVKGGAQSDADIVYTDGACRGNGKAGAVAGIGVWWGSDDPRNLSERCPGAQTNNRAELIAIVRTLETTPLEPNAGTTHPLNELPHDERRRKLVIRTDSQYSISCIEQWSQNWERSGWVSKGGKEVKNKALIQYLLSLLQLRAYYGHRVMFEYVRGHSGDRGNDAADALAVAGAQRFPEVPERDWDEERERIEEFVVLMAQEKRMEKKRQQQQQQHQQQQQQQQQEVEPLSTEVATVKEIKTADLELKAKVEEVEKVTKEALNIDLRKHVEFVIAEEDLLSAEEMEELEKSQIF